MLTLHLGWSSYLNPTAGPVILCQHCIWFLWRKPDAMSLVAWCVVRHIWHFAFSLCSILQKLMLHQRLHQRRTNVFYSMKEIIRSIISWKHRGWEKEWKYFDQLIQILSSDMCLSYWGVWMRWDALKINSWCPLRVFMHIWFYIQFLKNALYQCRNYKCWDVISNNGEFITGEKEIMVLLESIMFSFTSTVETKLHKKYCKKQMVREFEYLWSQREALYTPN